MLAATLESGEKFHKIYVAPDTLQSGFEPFYGGKGRSPGPEIGGVNPR